MKNPAETLAAIGAALDNPSPELAAVPGALAYMRADYTACVEALARKNSTTTELDHVWATSLIARLAAALRIEVQP